MSNPLFQAIDLDTNQPVGMTRHSFLFARSDARRHFETTGRHGAVCRIEMVWVTSTLDDSSFDDAAARA